MISQVIFLRTTYFLVSIAIILEMSTTTQSKWGWISHTFRRDSVLIHEQAFGPKVGIAKGSGMETIAVLGKPNVVPYWQK